MAFETAKGRERCVKASGHWRPSPGRSDFHGGAHCVTISAARWRSQIRAGERKSGVLMIMHLATALVACGIILSSSENNHAGTLSPVQVVCSEDVASVLSATPPFQRWPQRVVAPSTAQGLIRVGREALLDSDADGLVVVVGPATALLEASPPKSVVEQVTRLRWWKSNKDLSSETTIDGLAGLRGRAALLGTRVAVVIVGPREHDEAAALTRILENYPQTVYWFENEGTWLDQFGALWQRLASASLREPSFLGLRRFLRLREDQALQVRHDLEAGVLLAGGPGAPWSDALHRRLDDAVRPILSPAQAQRWEKIPEAVRSRLAERVYRELNAPKASAPALSPDEPVSADALARHLGLDDEDGERFKALLADMQGAFIALMEQEVENGGASPLAQLAARLQAEGPAQLDGGAMEALMKQPYAGGGGETYSEGAARLQRETLGALGELLSHEALAEFETLELESLFQIDAGAPSLEAVLADRVAVLKDKTASQAPPFWREFGWSAETWEEVRETLDQLKARNATIVQEVPAHGGLAPIDFLAAKLGEGAADAVPAFVAYLGSTERSAGGSYAEALAREETRAREALKDRVGEAGLAQLSARFPGSLSEAPTGSDPFEDALQERLP